MNTKLKFDRNASKSNVFTERDVIRFANISLDENPIHLNEEYAKFSIFGNG